MPKRDERTHLLAGGKIYGEGFLPVGDLPVKYSTKMDVASTQGFDLDSASKEEMQAEAERRGIEVKRADGKDAEPLLSDYREALK